ncbi:MAG: anthrone oxygenase family protein [Paracoccaceae bacterium]
MMKWFANASGLGGLVLSAAMFGFFYAWICSTMWGLDEADPRVSIAAMQAMNASVRNGVFAVAFFGTFPALLIASAFALAVRNPAAAVFFGCAALIYGVGGFGLTMIVLVPMNETLSVVSVPDSKTEALQIWSAYSGTWRQWNTTRAVACGVSFVSASLAFRNLGQARKIEFSDVRFNRSGVRCV